MHVEDAAAATQSAPAAEAEGGKHSGSTLTIGNGAGGAAPTVYDASTLRRLAAASAANSKTQLHETNVPRQRLRRHGVPILGPDGLPLRHNNNRVGLANAAAAAAAASSSVQEDETPGASALGATLKAG